MEKNKYCTCKTCDGDFGETNCDEFPENGILCTYCNEGEHIKRYRLFCETIVNARDSEAAYELGYQDIKEEDYQLEEL